jgi:hypothetical protein
VTALDLSEALVAEEIVRVRAEGWSGVLALTQGQVAKGVYFVDGGIAFAASTVGEDRLGAASSVRARSPSASSGQRCASPRRQHPWPPW